MHILLNANGRSKKHDVKSATEILNRFGLSKNDKTTQRLIREGKLKAVSAGKNPDDRRAGFIISEKDIYEFVTSEIPAVKDLYNMIDELKTKSANVGQAEKKEKK